MKKIILLTVSILITISQIHAEDFSFPFLDIETIGAKEFIKKNPKADGSGTLIFVLDCGADPAIPGLTLNPNGETKMIDIQDFSDQLVLSLSEAEFDTLTESVAIKSGDLRLYGWDKLKLKPEDDKYYIAILDESGSYKNSGTKDINRNGKTNDKFAFLAFELSKEAAFKDKHKGKVPLQEKLWVYYVDQDADGNFDDEQPMFNYKYNYDIFNFHSGEKEILPLLTMSANVNGEAKTIMVNTCDGDHGTHCAGIAAGYKVYGTAGNNGIAPGAYVVSLKIGSNILSGGSTTSQAMKRAYEYGIEFMKEAGFKNAVYSMSYGIGGEQPGKSDIEKFLNDFAEKHPEVIIVTSNGNNGPGINSTGNPSASSRIISAGAMISPETLRDLYGSNRQKPWITHFSSRGGETGKPDVMAPGAASSTVPNFTKGDAFWGTSMACPEVAGACAVLLSAANNDGLLVDGQMIKKAIKYTADKMDGYSYIDYGGGLTDIPEAYEYLKILADRSQKDVVLDYNISTENTFYSDQKGVSSFWKANGYYPEKGKKVSVSVTAVFPPHISELDKHNFYRVFKLKSDESWLKTDKSQIYLRATNTQVFSLLYDGSYFKKPGIYTAKVRAFPENVNSSKYAEFDVQATVVVPYKFNQDNSYSLKLKNQKLGIADIDRVFIETPPGVSGFNAKLSPADGFYVMGMYSFAPDGSRRFFNLSGDPANKKDINYNVSGDQLLEGIWELNPYCHYQSQKASAYNLDVQFYGIKSNPELISSIEIPQGKDAKGLFRLFNSFDKPVTCNLTGNISGYLKKEKIEQKEKKVFSQELLVDKHISKVEFVIDLPVEQYNKITDLAFNIYNQDGENVYSNGMSRKSKTFSYSPKAPGEYKIELTLAFVSQEIQNDTWVMDLTKKFYLKNNVVLSFDKNNFKLLPGLWYDIEFLASSMIPMAPCGHKTFGIVTLTDSNQNAVAKKIEIVLE